MRPFRSLIAIFVAAALTSALAVAAPRALGVVLHADKASVGSSDALPGATVFSGDSLTTTADGTLRLRIADAQLYLLPNAAVKLGFTKKWNVAELRQGGVGFSTTGDERVVVRVADVQVYPITPQPTHAEVSFLTPNELLVTSLKGPLEVMVGSEIHPVPEASAYRVLLEQDPPNDVEGAGTNQARRARVIAVTAGVAVAAGIVTLILLKNAISPGIPD